MKSLIACAFVCGLAIAGPLVVATGDEANAYSYSGIACTSSQITGWHNSVQSRTLVNDYNVFCHRSGTQ